MRKKKIFLISNMYPSIDNPGYGVFVRNVKEGLECCGYDIPYLSNIGGRGTTLLSRISKYLTFYWSILINYFKTYDILYVHYPTYSAPLLFLLMKIKRKSLVINFHGEDLIYDCFDAARYASILGHISDKLTTYYANMVVVPSDYFKDVVISRGLVAKDKIFVSPSGGINDSVFSYNGRNLEQDTITLGFVGRLQEDKGVFHFIEACKILSKKHNLKAFIIGYGPAINDVKEQTISCDFIELVGSVEQKNLPDYYRRMDLFCFPSKRRTESLGLVGVEAMACGVPVIGTNIGGIPTYLKDGYNGFLIQMDAMTDNIVNAVEKYVCLDSNNKELMMTNCLETAKQYAQGVVCRRLADLFANL